WGLGSSGGSASPSRQRRGRRSNSWARRSISTDSTWAATRTRARVSTRSSAIRTFPTGTAPISRRPFPKIRGAMPTSFVAARGKTARTTSGRRAATGRPAAKGKRPTSPHGTAVRSRYARVHASRADRHPAGRRDGGRARGAGDRTKYRNGADPSGGRRVLGDLPPRAGAGHHDTTAVYRRRQPDEPAPDGHDRRGRGPLDADVLRPPEDRSGHAIGAECPLRGAGQLQRR